MIEVADASRKRDRTIKQQIYASHGIPTYVIIDLIGRIVDVYSKPVEEESRYSESTRFSVHQTLSLPTGNDNAVALPVANLLR